MVKFLIAIVPQGVISFVSKGWGGRASDKHITENSGILSHLLPGDQILADRGFNVEETAGLYCAEVKIPPFTRGKKQLSVRWTLLGSYLVLEFILKESLVCYDKSIQSLKQHCQSMQ